MHRLKSSAPTGSSAILGLSEPMVSLRKLIDCLAPSAATALITGESGTGKELVAQALHQGSDREGGPFVPVNCGAIPRELIESELFGHRKGSFTGALSDRLGRFELAHGGTLFLDEIGDLPSDMQVKLLRVLQERAVLPVGASKEVPIDVRVIAATHKNLEDEVKQGRFREDLYYRINVLPIQTTPLRQRSDDVALLLTHYAERLARGGVQPVSFEPLFLNMLERYTWPGNVRELANLVDRLSTLLPGQNIGVRQVPTCMLPKALAAMQIEFISEQHGIQEVPLAVLYEKEAVHAQVEPQKNQDQGLLESTDDWVALLSATVASEPDRKSTRLNSSHTDISRMPSSA